MAVWDIADALWAYRIDGDWVIGDLPVARIVIDGDPVLGSRQPSVTNPTGGTTVDSQARAAIVALLDAARAHGLISA